ncbi:MAG: hypothetical protein IT175_06195 [Acidobacteria bacterium]|nr:hypothetical protein [Acidobacteriota bacterium]
MGELAGVSVNMTTDLTDNLTWLFGPPGVRMRNTNNQSISNNSDTNLTLNTTVYDTDGMAGTNSVICQTDGEYLVGGCVVFEPAANGARRARIWDDTLSLALADHEWPLGGFASAQIDLVPFWRGTLTGKTIRLRAYQNSGGAINSANINPYAPVLYAQWVGE